MSYGVKLLVKGDYALFTRPELKVERVSYDVMTPSAARAIIEAIYWKPAIRWVIDSILVLNPVKFDNLRRNEVSFKIAERNVSAAMKDNSALYLYADDSSVRQQRASTLLRDVAYIIEAHFEYVPDMGDENDGKHLEMFNRRLENGQCFSQPYLGTREFSCSFEPVKDEYTSKLQGERDLGIMLFDLDFSDKRNPQPLFFRAKLNNGLMSVPHPDSEEILR
jgi:CRISPR-associated protein Cas5d